MPGRCPPPTTTPPSVVAPAGTVNTGLRTLGQLGELHQISVGVQLPLKSMLKTPLVSQD